MEGNATETTEIKIGDRVIQANAIGPKGRVQNVRIETTRSTIKQNADESLGISITVLWDNGTLSHFVPEGLKKVDS